MVALVRICVRRGSLASVMTRKHLATGAMPVAW